MSTLPRTIVALTAVAAIALAGCGGGGKSSTSSSTTPSAKPQANSVAATPTELTQLAKKLGHDVFWAGPKRGFTYELTRTGNGNVYIRYLPPGVPVGAGSADFLAIGTYPQPDAFGTIKQAQKRAGEIVTKLRGGGVAVQSKRTPTSVYFAYPGSKLLVEVYDPKPSRARRAVLRSQVNPIR